MNATAYEIRREAISGPPTNMYDDVACSEPCDAVMHWSNGFAMDWIVNQEMKVVGS